MTTYTKAQTAESNLPKKLTWCMTTLSPKLTDAYMTYTITKMGHNLHKNITARNNYLDFIPLIVTRIAHSRIREQLDRRIV